MVNRKLDNAPNGMIDITGLSAKIEISGVIKFTRTCELVTCWIYVPMTIRALVILLKCFIDKNLGAYRANVQKNILVKWNMSLLQRVISARRFRIGILAMVHASD